MLLKTANSIKQAVGAAAAGLVQNGMIVGLGSGTTSACFIDALVQRCQAGGISIQAVATSNASAKQAEAGGIAILNVDEVDHIDLVVDGADEIDPQRRMIKGGGGALLREKIIARAADEMVVIVDETKLVDRLGTFGLPLEIVPFGQQHTMRQLEQLGYRVELRKKHSGEPFVTDNGNLCFDVSFSQPISSPEEVDQEIRALPGVVETGLFLGLAGRVIVGYGDGRVEIEAR